MNINQRNQAILFHNQGLEIAKKDQQSGYRLLCSSVDIDPNFPDGWYSIGNANSDMNLYLASVAAYRRAVEADPKNVRAWTNLGHKLYHIGDHLGAQYATRQALGIDPYDPFATCNLSLIQSIFGDLESSLASAKRANSILPSDPTIQIQLAFANLFMKKWEEGLKWFEARFPYQLQQYLTFPMPMWKGEYIADKTLFLVSEMGMGDTLSFMRFLPAVSQRAGKIRLQVHSELQRVVGAMVAAHGLTNVEISPLGMVPAADFWCATTSMPVALGWSSEQIAGAKQLAVPLAGLSNRPEWKARDRKLHVGVCWGGAPANAIDKWRSTEVTRFLELYKVPGIQLYSLQIGPRAIELHNLGCAALVRDLSHYVRDVMDTMSIIRDLDLIITVETSLGHIAGAIDAECWILNAYNGGDWRIGRKGKKSLWYDRHRVFRQGSDASWDKVFNNVVDELRERVR